MRADVKQTDLKEAEAKRTDVKRADVKWTDLKRTDVQQADVKGTGMKRAKEKGTHVIVPNYCPRPPRSRTTDSFQGAGLLLPVILLRCI